MRVVFGVTVGLMILILFLIFRNLTGMIAPIGVGLISTFIGLGFVGFTGINFSPLLYVLAFLVGARKISHSVQITHRYFEELHAHGNDRKQACFETMRTMIMPNVAGVVTDAAGFLVLLLAKIVLMQHIAILMSFWMLSIAFSAILTPIICSFIPLGAASKAWSENSAEPGVWDRVNMTLARFSIGHGRYALIVGIICLLAFCGWQTTKLNIGDATPGSPILWPNHPYNLDQALISRTFRQSSDNFVLYYEGEPESAKYPEVLVTFQKFDNYMAEALPDIYKSSSSAIDAIKGLNLMYHEGDLLWYQFPRKEEMLLHLAYLFEVGNMATAKRFMDIPEPAGRAQITLFFADHTSDNMLRIKKAAYDFFKDHPMETQHGKYLLAGGRVGLEIALNEEMTRSHLLIDGMVLVTIFIVCALCFRSSLAAAMLTVPLIIANMGAFAYMCLMNIGLSVNTLPVAAVGVGVGVDFAIYLYSRCREEFPKYNDWTQTIMVSVTTCGKAIVYTGLTLVLAILPWYFLCEMKFQAQMGLFLSMLLLINVVLALTLHPLLIFMIKPNFLKKGVTAQEVATEDAREPLRVQAY
jgi:predicted RND superfamily exporter protein